MKTSNVVGLISAMTLTACLNVDADFGTTTLGAPCTSNDGCNDDLVCRDNRCVTNEEEGDPCVDAAAAGFSASNNGQIPPLDAVRCITGDVVLSSAATADALAEIEVITGSLTVTASTMAALRLPALHEVGGDVAVGTFSLAEFDEFELPASIGNGALTDVELYGLTAVGGSVYIASNDRLQRVSLARATAPLVIGGSLVVYENDVLDGDEQFDEDLNNDGGTSQLHIVEAGGSVLFWNNASTADDEIVWRLPTLARLGTAAPSTSLTLQNLVEQYGPLDDRLSHGSVLMATTNQNALDVPVHVELPALTTITGSVGFNLGSLTDVALPSLVTAGGLDVANGGFTRTVEAPLLAELTGLPETATNIALYLFDDPQLTTLDLPRLQTIRGALQLGGTSLTNFCGMPATTVIEGSITINDSESLRSLAGLGGLTSAGDAVTISETAVPDCQVQKLRELAGTSHGTTCDIPGC